MSPPINEFPLAFIATAAKALPFVTPRILGTDMPPIPLPFPFGMRCIPVVCIWGGMAPPGPPGPPPPTFAARPPRKSVRPLSAVMLVRALMAPGLASSWASGARAAGVGPMPCCCCWFCWPGDEDVLDAFVLDMDEGECDRDVCWTPPFVRPRAAAAAAAAALPLAFASMAAISPPPTRPEEPLLLAAAAAAAAATAWLRVVLEVLVVVVVVEDEDEVGLFPSVRFAFWSSTLQGKRQKREQEAHVRLLADGCDSGNKDLR